MKRAQTRMTAKKLRSRVYTCPYCKADGKTVTWDDHFHTYLCSACGQVDMRRSREEKRGIGGIR